MQDASCSAAAGLLPPAVGLLSPHCTVCHPLPASDSPLLLLGPPAAALPLLRPAAPPCYCPLRPAAACLQIFEVYGLGREVIDTAFAGTVSRIGGMSLADIQREGEAFWAKGFPSQGLTKLDDYGFIQSRPKGEYHANNQVRCGVAAG